jgi:hypothetical protein
MNPPSALGNMKASGKTFFSDIFCTPASIARAHLPDDPGLTSPQKKRKRTTPCSEPFSLVTGSNQLWCMDFKGYFTTGDGKRCDPFTISQVRAICKQPCESMEC